MRAEAEYEALRLNLGLAEILTFYAGWGSGFGKPERGAEAADRAIRFNPHHLPWHGIQFSYAYCNAGDMTMRTGLISSTTLRVGSRARPSGCMRSWIT